MPEERCLVCGADCSKPPRARDGQGRFLCVKCFTERKRAALAGAPAAGAAGAAEAGGGAAPAGPGGPPADDGLNPIPLADDPADEALLSQAVAAGAAATAPRACPHCAVILARDAVICTQCGFNTVTGRNVGTGRGARAGQSCRKCGYSLEGLKSPRCPECGTVNSPGNKRDLDRQVARDVARREYIKPLIMLGAGVLLSVLFSANRADPVAGLLAYAASVGVQTAMGFVIYFVCILLGFDADSPLPLAALRLVGVYALFNAVVGLVFLIPIPFVPLCLAIFILGGLLTNAFDFDFQDGVILALLNIGAWIALLIVRNFM